MTLSCHDDQRRALVRQHTLNGLDYLEVSDDQLTLTVYFLGKLPAPLQKASKTLANYVRIEGGRRIRDIKVLNVTPYPVDDPELDDFLLVRVDKFGDFSTYTLRLVGLDGIDPRYDRVDFSFKVGCPSDLDCLPANPCPPPVFDQPEINYLAKDYASFRQLILDRLALIMPTWQERHIPDLGITLVELLAYVGDYLSYYQDAVATEAYLDTARQRISVRRHARLVDYALHEGCNARTWVCVNIVDTDKLPLNLSNFYFITGLNDALPVNKTVLSEDDLRAIAPNTYEVFEPLAFNFQAGVASATIDFYAAHNAITFYTWGERECCLPSGATTATLTDRWHYPTESASPTGKRTGKAKATDEPPSLDPSKLTRALQLQVGDVLIFEEVIGPKTGIGSDADPAHRHAVRLTRVQPHEDAVITQPLKVGEVTYELPTPVVEIEWSVADALPFALCLSAIGPAPQCTDLENISVACGNVILVDHGRTVQPSEPLGQVPVESTQALCDCVGHPGDVLRIAGRFRPQLAQTPLTFSQRLAPANPAHQRRRKHKHDLLPAAQLLTQDVHWALPHLQLRGLPAEDGSAPLLIDGIQPWEPHFDLLASQPDDRHFVVEIDNAGVAQLRFGDGELGQQPAAGTSFTATYRVGNGVAGNVGAEAISHLVLRPDTTVSGATVTVRNPLPAQGGTDAEPIAEVKLFAPMTFRKQIERAITAADYARLTERNPAVQRAATTLTWTGSWYEAEVALDPHDSEVADRALVAAITGDLYRYRRIGHDLAVRGARYVSLDIAMTVCVAPHHFRGHVKAALQTLFSNRRLADGKLGFFHPDNLTFGDNIYLSKLVATAQAVVGVESVQVTKLQRQFELPNHEIENGVLPLGRLEVARLDNDPSFPEHGRLALSLKGGR